MTYFGFLLIFLLIPVVIFFIINRVDTKRGLKITGFIKSRGIWIGIGIQVVLALAYTTPWDNYLVAHGIWTYDPRLVSGLVMGWVPIEEYIFFVVETILTGLWWWFLVRRIKLKDEQALSTWPGITALTAVCIIWSLSVAIFLIGWEKATYMSLILAWALLPFAVQLAFGAGILWRYRKLLGLTIFPMFIYLSIADAAAISSGTWQINPVKSSGVLIGPLPLEEAVFFLVTVSLISFGLTLSLSTAGQTRLNSLLITVKKFKRS